MPRVVAILPIHVRELGWFQSPADSSTLLSCSICSGSIEKYLWRHGSQRNAGMRSLRHTNAVRESTYSGEIRFKAGFPQIGQCACSERRSGISRA